MTDEMAMDSEVEGDSEAEENIVHSTHTPTPRPSRSISGSSRVLFYNYQ